MRTKEQFKREAQETFSLDPTALPDYIDNKGDIIVNLISRAQTLAMITPQTGIKAGSTERLNILSTGVVWSDGDCVSSPTGATTVLTPRDISTVRLTDREELCLDLLDAKLPMIQAAGARNEELPFSALYIETKVMENAKALEKLTWQGSIATGAGNLALQDGYLELALQDTGNLGYEQTYGAGDFSAIADFSADPIKAVELFNANMPEEMDDRDDVIFFVSNSNFKALAKDIRDTYGLDATGVFLDSGFENQEGRRMLKFPGTEIIVMGTHGLSGSDSMFGTYLENLRYGTDLENDKEDVDLFFDKKDKVLVSDVVFSIGYQWQDSSQIMIVGA